MFKTEVGSSLNLHFPHLRCFMQDTASENSHYSKYETISESAIERKLSTSLNEVAQVVSSLKWQFFEAKTILDIFLCIKRLQKTFFIRKNKTISLSAKVVIFEILPIFLVLGLFSSGFFTI